MVQGKCVTIALLYLLMLCLRIRGVAYVAQDTLLWKDKTCPAGT